MRGNYKHGMRYTPEYSSWCHMKERCLTPSSHKYLLYGGRGIKICDRWRDSFQNFYEDMGAKPGSGYTLDRIDNNGDYEPGNCRWANSVEQANNRRDNIWLDFQGKRKSIADWARTFGLTYMQLQVRRSKGWPLERALTQPVRKRSV